jgi:hypothetical protein
MDTEKGAFAGLAASFRAELEPKHADLLLFACCLTSGLVDSTIYNGESHIDPGLCDLGETDLSSLQHLCVHADRYDLNSGGNPNSI